MKILAFETSCDETAAAIVQDGRQVLAQAVETQAPLHQPYGGVIPEMASRQHLLLINRVLEQLFASSSTELSQVDAFAATLGPGLVGSLLVGATAAKTLALVTGKPFLGVHHLHGHIASNYLDSDLSPPYLCLLVSGGHTQLIHVESYTQLTLLGQTLDDAAGEAYDKIARLLGLGYPGGPLLDQLAQSGDPSRFSLPTGKTQRPYDFSFSGLKTATARLIEQVRQTNNDWETLKPDLAASFQATVSKTLIKKTIAAAKAFQIHTISVAGGVAANSALRQGLAQAAESIGAKFYRPPMAYCTDNAAMIAASAFFNPLTRDMAAEVFSRTFTPLSPAPQESVY